MLNAEVTQAGDLVVEGQKLGRMEGFRFTPDPETGGEAAKVATLAIAGAVAREADARAARLSEAVDASLVLANDGAIRWLGDPVAKLIAGEKQLQPRAVILADEAVTSAAKEIAQRRIDLWLAAHVRRTLGALLDLEAGEGLEGAARGVAFQIADALGVLDRGRVAQEVKGLDQNQRGALRKLGVRFGAYYLYAPALLKPAPRQLALQLWTLKSEQPSDHEPFNTLPQLAGAGRTSFLVDKPIPRDMLRVAGFRLCGDRAVRVDILERLADLIRPAVAHRPGVSPGPPPAGAADRDGFVVTVAMTSLTGCSGEALGSILRALGFESRKIKGPAITAPTPAASSAAESTPPPVDGEHQPRAAADDDSASPAPAPEAGAPPTGADLSESVVPPAATLAGEALDVAAGAAPPPAPEAASSEPGVADATAPLAQSPSGEAPAEEALIEVWRPVHRRRHESRPPRRAQGEKSALPTERLERRGSPARSAPAIDGERAAAEVPEPATTRADTEPGAPARREGPHIARAEHRSKKTPPGREVRRADAPQRSAPRERPIDPNSPFAKLLALKTELEAKQRGQ
ncbi:MAG TPA: helicase, partial [Roseiarcus sp.]|nr:helicase [Roseiarcus sp.]